MAMCSNIVTAVPHASIGKLVIRNKKKTTYSYHTKDNRTKGHGAEQQNFQKSKTTQMSGMSARKTFDNARSSCMIRAGSKSFPTEEPETPDSPRCELEIKSLTSAEIHLLDLNAKQIARTEYSITVGSERGWSSGVCPLESLIRYLCSVYFASDEAPRRLRNRAGPSKPARNSTSVRLIEQARRRLIELVSSYFPLWPSSTNKEQVATVLLYLFFYLSNPPAFISLQRVRPTSSLGWCSSSKREGRDEKTAEPTDRPTNG